MQTRSIKIDDRLNAAVTPVHSNEWVVAPSILPERFSSISAPIQGSVIPSELGSLSLPIFQQQQLPAR
jgi:hypothetical protein